MHVLRKAKNKQQARGQEAKIQQPKKESKQKENTNY